MLDTVMLYTEVKMQHDRDEKDRSKKTLAKS